MSGEILFLSHRLPFPPDRGDKIRSHHVLKALAKLAPVRVGCLAEDAQDLAHECELERIAASHCMPRRSKPLPLAGLEALGRREPVSMAAFRSERLARWVTETIRERDIAAIYVFSGQMGQYVPHDWRGRLLVDLVDVDSAKFEAYARDGSGPRAWIDAREGRLLRQVEAELVARSDTTLLVSETEAELLRSRVAGEHDIRALRNGIDCAFYDPAEVQSHPQLAQAGPQFVFTGQMDYAPNVAAVVRFAEAILPRIRQGHPHARFHIVGRSPSASVKSLGKHPGVTVWGAVADVRPFLAGADLVVVPLTMARGIQNKVLEAMAMARCVIASPEAASGIDAINGEHIAVAGDDAAFVRSALYLLERSSEREAIGKAARKLVDEKMNWCAALASLPKLIGLDKEGERNAA